MTDYLQRLYGGEDDFLAMRRLVIESYALNSLRPQLLVGDLDWWRALLAEPEVFLPGVPLWFAGEQLAGFAWAQPGERSADLIYHPDHAAVLPAMIASAEEHLASPERTSAHQYVRLWSRASDGTFKDLLAGRGFTRTEEFLAAHILPLEGDLPEIKLPEGFRVRPVHGLDEAEARVAVHRAAFGTTKHTLAKYHSATQRDGYRRDLDLVVEAPDGQFAAFTIVWFDAVNRAGLFEPVGCRPEFQRKGLATAVMTYGLHRLKEVGAVRAHVGSWRDDSAGAKCYRSQGFREIDRFYAWDKPLENTADGLPAANGFSG